jgi:hypothetical protein
MAWDETTGIDSVDQELQRRLLLAKLPPVSLLTAQKDTLPAPIQRFRENPENAFNLPPVSLTTQSVQSGGNAANPTARPGSSSGSSYDNVVSHGASDSDWLENAKFHERLQREEAAKRGAGVQDAQAITAGGLPAVRLTNSTPQSGQSLQPSTTPSSTNTSQLMSAIQGSINARQVVGDSGGAPSAIQGSINARQVVGDSGGAPSAIQGSINARQVTTDTPAAQVVAQPRSSEEEYRALLKQEPTRDQFPAAKMPLWKKALGVVASTAAGAGGGGNLAGETASRFFQAPERKAEEQFTQAHETWAGKLANVVKAANLGHLDTEDRNLQSEIDARNRPKPERPENLDREAYDYYVGQGMTPADARKRVLKDSQEAKGERPTHTSPFEAFAYGSPEEKKAAQDFLDMEKRLGSRYKNPSEFEEKYRLFKQDPETYRAMFGDKSGSAPDRRTATSMLTYFDKRRREVNGDFTLDDEQKRQQLQEIGNLERPFLDAVQPGSRNGTADDRVTVMHPNGKIGTVPRSQLGAAKKKGYKEVPQQ